MSTFRLTGKELHRQERLKSKVASDDGDSDDDDDNSTLSYERKKKTMNKKGGAGKKRKCCKREGCAKWAVRGGVCQRHGAVVKQKKTCCKREGCANQAVQGGVCQRHGAVVTRTCCSHLGCTNIAKRAGVCKRHGANVVPRCNYEGCTCYAQIHMGGLCNFHKSLVDTPSDAELLPHPTKEYEATPAGTLTEIGGEITPSPHPTKEYKATTVGTLAGIGGEITPSEAELIPPPTKECEATTVGTLAGIGGEIEVHNSYDAYQLPRLLSLARQQVSRLHLLRLIERECEVEFRRRLLLRECLQLFPVDVIQRSVLAAEVEDARADPPHLPRLHHPAHFQSLSQYGAHGRDSVAGPEHGWEGSSFSRRREIKLHEEIGEKSPVFAPGEVEMIPKPAEGYKVTTESASASPGGEIEVNYPSDDEEKIGAWIWKSSRITKGSRRMS